MHHRHPPLRAMDMPLVTVVVMLCGLSLVALYSASGADVDTLIRQGMRLAFAFVLMIVFSHIPPIALARWSPHVYGLGMAALVAVLAAGIVGHGAQRWLDFGLFRFQPAEMMKLVVPMMVAWILTRWPLPPRPLGLLLAVVAVLVPTVLVMVQPDLGTAILICLAGLLVVFLGGVDKRLVFVVLAGLGAAAPVLWSVVLHDYQRRRILTLFDPWADPLGAGYHAIQSLIAVGSGGLFGKGWLAGSQSRLDFIPERSTDFVFAVYAEEFGFLGALLLLALYLFAVYRGLHIAYHAHGPYARLMGGCVTITFLCYAFVNIGMVIGILPVVGVPLPLISHGGSSLVTLMVGFGILLSIHRHKHMVW